MIKGNVLIYTHTDMDGFGSNLIANYIENNYEDVKFTVKNLNYDQINEEILKDIRDESIFTYDYIFITDISVSEETSALLNILWHSNDEYDIVNLELLDHHESALWLNKYDWCNVILTKYNRKISGTELFADSIFEDNIPEDIFNLIENIKLYDTWLWVENNNQTPKKLNDLFLLLGFEAFERRLIEVNYDVNKFILKHRLLLQIQQKQIDRYIKGKDKNLIVKEIQDRKVGIVFGDKYQSELGNTLAKLHPELDIVAMIGDTYVSYRSVGDCEKNNCKSFSELYGGGGHFNSAGSTINKSVINNYLNELFNIKK